MDEGLPAGACLASKSIIVFLSLSFGSCPLGFPFFVAVLSLLQLPMIMRWNSFSALRSSMICWAEITSIILRE